MNVGGYNFGEKHLCYMRRCLNSKVNVAEGAVRAGKTVDNVYVFGHLLERSPDRYHLATGATASSAKITIGDCNGLGLEKRFEGRYKWCLHRGCECMKVQTKTGEKIIVFAGGKNADSYKKIRGNSYGMWIATEINLHHGSMIREAFNRQLAAADRRVFWDLNPSAPSSPIYTEYIDRYAEGCASGKYGADFYNYGHFTIYDNPNVTPERLREVESQYEKGSVWYRRDILGERCSAEGAIYTYFTSNREKIVIPMDSLGGRRIDFINVGVDFGGNKSRTTFAATAFLGSSLCVVKDHVIDGRKGEIDPLRVNEDFLNFVRSLRRSFPGVHIKYAFCDSEAQYLINGLRSFMKKSGDSITVGECVKRRIRDRIDCVNSLMVQGRFFILEECRSVQRGFAEAIWDPASSEDVRLDNFTSDIDILDAVEYSFERYMGKLVRIG